MVAIREWLEEIGLEKYAGVFEVNEITLELASRLSDTDLKELGMGTMGHRKMFFQAVETLGGPLNTATSETSVIPAVDKYNRLSATSVVTPLPRAPASTSTPAAP